MIDSLRKGRDSRAARSSHFTRSENEGSGRSNHLSTSLLSISLTLWAACIVEDRLDPHGVGMLRPCDGSGFPFEAVDSEMALDQVAFDAVERDLAARAGGGNG